MSTNDDLFTPEEVLGGFSAKRARLLLFQIESRTAHLMLQSQRAVNPYLTEEAAKREDIAFFEALAEGREPPVRPTIRDIERYAPQWQALVPSNASLQATLAHRLAQKYRFAQRAIPHIRQALALESEGVRQAFQRQYQQPLDTIYSKRVKPLEWAGWQWNKLSAWLEHLPPFWTAYALTFTQVVGTSILALPIAIASVGLLPGLIILVIVGLINMLTMAAQRTKKWIGLRQLFNSLQEEVARSWLSLIPLLLLFLLIEWLLANKLDSFPQLLSFRGAVTVAVVGSAFPVLLLVASRRKGEHVPAMVLSFLANPLIAGGIYLIAIASLFMHGLLIWQNPFQRGVASSGSFS